ncbi:MAG: beta strand repeat-containing protein [Terrimicrobiaceae bacterium]
MKINLAKMSARLRRIQLIVSAIMLQGTLAFAINWDGGGGANTDIALGANWAGDVAPGSGTFGYFNLNSGSFYTVSSTNAYSIGGVLIATDKVNFDFTGNTVTVTGGADFTIGYIGATGQVKLLGGTLAASAIRVGGDNSGGNGSLTVDNATMTSSNRLNLGNGSGITGNLTVQNGGQVTASSNGVNLALGGTASIVVSGTGSSLIAAGIVTSTGSQASTSNISVSNGALLSTGGSFYASQSTNANTHIAVQNSGSLSISSHLGLGGTNGAVGGTASLSITDGSSVSTGLDTKVWGGGVLNLSNSVLTSRYVTLGNNTVGQAGATLVGSGTIKSTSAGNITEIGGIFKPGDTYTTGGGVVAAIGTLVIGKSGTNMNLQLDSVATTTFDFNSASSFDQVIVFGNFTVGGVLNLNMNFDPWNGGAGTSFTLFDISGSHTGSFSSVNLTSGYDLVSAGFVGNDYIINAIPEPSSAATLSLGLFSLVLLSRFRRRKKIEDPV